LDRTKYQEKLAETFHKKINKFLESILPNCKKVVYYNKEEKRCDIKAFKRAGDNYQSNYHIIYITFEPDYPEEDANEDIFKC